MEENLLASLRERPDTTETAYKSPVVAFYPKDLSAGAADALYLAVAQAKQFSNLETGIPALTALLARTLDAPAPAHFELAEAYGHTGDTVRALARYEIALKKAPNFQPAALAYARAFTQSNRLELAAQIIEKFIGSDSADAVVLNSLGLVRAKRGKVVEAVLAFRKATES